MTVQITLGALAPSISEQLRQQGVTVPEGCAFLDDDAWQIARLSVRGLLTEAETARARKRLMANVRTALRKALGMKSAATATGSH